MSLTNREIKLIRSLSARKAREENGLFVVEGEKMVSEALASPFEVLEVYRREEIGEEAMSRISSMSSASPALALVRIPPQSELTIGEGLYLALDTIRDPGNLGTIIRLADWFGIEAVVAGTGTVELYNPKVIQATMGAIFRVKVHYMDMGLFCDRLLERGGRLFGTFLDGEDIYSHELDNGVGHPSAIIVGNESEGISKAVAGKVTDRLFIPPYPSDDPGSESLNAAIATAITVSEFRRRNKK